jgi:glutamine synthetase
MAVGNGHDRPGGWAPPTLADMVARLRGAGTATAHVGIFDLFGTVRECRLALEDPPQVFGEGGSFVNGLPHWEAGEHVFGAGPFIGELVAIDPASARPYPFEPAAAFIVAIYAGPSAALSPHEIFGAAFIDHFARACRTKKAALRRATGAPNRARYLEFV